MGKSLQDQLKSLGIVGKAKDEKKGPQQKTKRRPQSPSPQKNAAAQAVVREERDVLGKQVREKRKIREREDEAARAEKLRRRAAETEAREYLEAHRVERLEDGLSYRFNMQGMIRRIFVTQEVADQLSAGTMGIVVAGEAIDVVPTDIAQKVGELSERVTVIINDPASGQDGDDPDDPYSEYQVPDDLVW